MRKMILAFALLFCVSLALSGCATTGGGNPAEMTVKQAKKALVSIQNVRYDTMNAAAALYVNGTLNDVQIQQIDEIDGKFRKAWGAAAQAVDFADMVGFATKFAEAQTALLELKSAVGR